MARDADNTQGVGDPQDARFENTHFPQGEQVPRGGHSPQSGHLPLDSALNDRIDGLHDEAAGAGEYVPELAGAGEPLAGAGEYARELAGAGEPLAGPGEGARELAGAGELAGPGEYEGVAEPGQSLAGAGESLAGAGESLASAGESAFDEPARRVGEAGPATETEAGSVTEAAGPGAQAPGSSAAVPGMGTEASGAFEGADMPVDGGAPADRVGGWAAPGQAEYAGVSGAVQPGAPGEPATPVDAIAAVPVGRDAGADASEAYAAADVAREGVVDPAEAPAVRPEVGGRDGAGEALARPALDSSGAETVEAVGIGGAADGAAEPDFGAATIVPGAAATRPAAGPVDVSQPGPASEAGGAVAAWQASGDLAAGEGSREPIAEYAADEATFGQVTPAADQIHMDGSDDPTFGADLPAKAHDSAAAAPGWQPEAAGASSDVLPSAPAGEQGLGAVAEAAEEGSAAAHADGVGVAEAGHGPLAAMASPDANGFDAAQPSGLAEPEPQDVPVPEPADIAEPGPAAPVAPKPEDVTAAESAAFAEAAPAGVADPQSWSAVDPAPAGERPASESFAAETGGPTLPFDGQPQAEPQAPRQESAAAVTSAPAVASEPAVQDSVTAQEIAQAPEPSNLAVPEPSNLAAPESAPAAPELSNLAASESAPAAVTEQPAFAQVDPGASDEVPAASAAPSPTEAFGQSAPAEGQPTALDAHPATAAGQPSALERHPAAAGEPPATAEEQSTAAGELPQTPAELFEDPAEAAAGVGAASSLSSEADPELASGDAPGAGGLSDGPSAPVEDDFGIPMYSGEREPAWLFEALMGERTEASRAEASNAANAPESSGAGSDGSDGADPDSPEATTEDASAARQAADAIAAGEAEVPADVAVSGDAGEAGYAGAVTATMPAAAPTPPSAFDAGSDGLGMAVSGAPDSDTPGYGELPDARPAADLAAGGSAAGSGEPSADATFVDYRAAVADRPAVADGAAPDAHDEASYRHDGAARSALPFGLAAAREESASVASRSAAPGEPSAAPGEPSAAPGEPSSPGGPSSSAVPSKPSSSGTPSAGDDEPPAEPPAKRKRRLRWPFFVLPFLLLAVVYVGVAYYFTSNIPSRASVAGVDIGGMSRAEAAEKLNAELAPRVDNPMTVKVGSQTRQINPSDFSAAFDTEATLDSISGFSLSPGRVWDSISGGSDVAPVVKVDETKLSNTVKALTDQTISAPVNASIVFEGTRPVTTSAAKGETIDREAALTAMRTGAVSSDPVVIPVTREDPEITDDEATKAVNDYAKPLVSGNLTVTVDSTPVNITPEQLASVARFSADDGDLVMKLDPTALGDLVRAGAPSILKDGKDATIEIVNHQTPKITPSEDGVGIDDDRLSEDATKAVLSSDRTVQIDTQAISPEFTTEDAEKMGVKEVVSEIETPLTDDEVRTTNLRVGTGKVTNTLVKPGEQFSLLDTLGPIDASNGFVSSGVVANGFNSTAMGGGLSQLSTNMYNIGFLAGYEDIEHKPHSKYFERYPMGREATLWEGQIDMVWENNTPYGAVIDTWVADGKVHSRLWSTKYWKVETKTSDPYNRVAPTTKRNPSADCEPSGAGDSGFTVDIWRKVSREGEVHEEKTTSWTYDPVDAVVCD